MKRVRTSLFFVAALGLLVLCGSAWGVESSESIQGLISQWKFDEGEGSIAYDSAGNNNGTIYGAQWTTGQVDGALSFNGVDDYVQLPAGAADLGLEYATQSFTIEMWLKTIQTEERYLFDNYRYTLGDISFRIDAGKIEWHIGKYRVGNYILFRSEASVNDGLWHHVACTWDGAGEASIFVDGNYSGSSTNPNLVGSLESGYPFLIGTRIESSGLPERFFRGTIDEVAIYQRALTAEEVWQLYQDGLPNLVGLEIVGPGEVAEDFRASYKAIAHYDNNSTRDVTNSALWAVEPNTAANIDENGVLTTKDIVREQAATILASYTEGDVTFDAEKAIHIFAICPTGTALQFDGVDDYVDCGNDSNLNVGDGSYTLAAWIKTALSPLSPRGVILAKMKDGGSYQGYDIKINPDGTIWPHLISSWSSNAIRVHGSTAINDGSWHHVTVTYDGSNSASGFSIYIDGKPETLTTTHDSLSGSTVNDANFTIGSRYGGEYLNGKIDEVAIYNRALSIEEIQANMHTRLLGSEPGLVGYWDFDEGEGQIVYDLSGNGNNGQLGSTPDPDESDPAWVDSDAPIGICSLYQIATMAVDRAVECKTALLEELLAALAKEWTAYETLEELFESGDYGDLNKGDIVTAKQKIHSAIQHEEQSIDALEKSIEKLKDALSALGYEPEPPPM